MRVHQRDRQRLARMLAQHLDEIAGGNARQHPRARRLDDAEPRDARREVGVGAV
jgi:hypothetical protein